MIQRNYRVHRIALIAFTAISAAVLEAAGPIMHVYCAELFFAYCQPHYSEKQKEAFIRGTLFPDIRYITGLPRTSTHKKKVSLDSVYREKEPFIAGILFHSYVDDHRAQRAWGAGMHRLVQYQDKKNSHILKLIEDELCYAHINVTRVQKALNQLYSSELQPGVRFYHQLLYNSNLLDYFSRSPLELFATRAHTKRGYLLLSLSTVQKWTKLIENYAKNDKVISYVQALLSEFKQLISSYVQKKRALPQSGSTPFLDRYFKKVNVVSKKV